MTSPIVVHGGVLQGDSLSPLLFNLVVNTLIAAIKQVNLTVWGYVYDYALAPKHWMQFADDTALVTALEPHNQYLCNAFAKWSTWAGLVIKVSKCHVFGMKKIKTDITQYKPFITISKVPIPPVELNENFTYLGKDFSLTMICDHVKNELIQDISCYLQKIDRLPLHPLQKIEICQLYVFSKLKWRFTIHNLSEIWVIQNIDNHFSKFYRKWLELPVSANITHLSLSNNTLGLNIRTAKQIYNECKITVRRILRCSVNEEARKLYEITTIKNVNSDSVVNKAVSEDLPNHKVKEKCKSIFTKEKTESIWNDFMGLKEQCVITKYIVDVCLTKDISSWQMLVK